MKSSNNPPTAFHYRWISWGDANVFLGLMHPYLLTSTYLVFAPMLFLLSKTKEAKMEF